MSLASVVNAASQKKSSIINRQLLAQVIFLLAIIFTSQQTLSAPFNDNFNNNTGTTSSFSRDLGGISFTYSFTANGDGGDFVWESTFGEGNSASINLQSGAFNTGTTERVTITRTDLADFTFTSLFVDNAGGTTVTVGGYLNGTLVGSAQTVVNGVTGTLNFVGIIVDEVRISATDMINTNIDSFVGDSIASNNDGTLTAGGGVAEPVGLSSAVDTVGEAVNVFDFTLTDGGSGDGAALSVSSIAVQVSGTTNDTVRNQITWRLNGDDATNVTGTYNSVNDTLTFSGLNISVADGGNETYTINAYYNTTSSLTEDQTIVLSIDGDDHLTLGSGSQMSGSNSTLSTGNMTVDIIATSLAFTTQPAGSVSGSALTTQPVITARDASGNTDVDFTETVTVTEASAGSLANNTQAAVAGVATFTTLTYSASADQQTFTLTANDQDGVGSNLPTTDSSTVTSDVVATQLVFTTQPAPTTVVSGQATDFTTDPVIAARDANGITDTGYSTSFVLAEVNGAGSATMTVTGDEDGATTTVTLTPTSGTATFTNLNMTYTNLGAGSEAFNLRASSGGLTTADSDQLTSSNLPVVSSVSVPANATYTTGQNLDFTTNTSQNITVNTGGGTPRIALTVGATTRYADYLSGSGTSALTFRYTVQAGDSDTDGITLGSLDANGGTLQDGATNNLITTLNSVGPTTAVLVDALAPTLASSNPADNATGVAFDADITLNFSENVSAGAGNVAVYDAADDSLVESFSAASLGIAANVVTIDLSDNLMAAQSYYVQIANNAFADAAGNSYSGIADETTFNFTVGNNAPVAAGDSATTNEDNAVAVNVLANDSDSDGSLNAASTAIVAAPANGSTSINTANGVITYTPNANFNGSDSFTYSVEDAFGAISNTATVAITITAVNDAPVAANDMVSTPEDTPLDIDVADNDSDVDTGDSVNTATIAIVSGASNGSAVVNAGQVTYTPAANFNGSDSFTYTIEDQNGATSNTATVVINVTGVNDLPVAANDSASVDEDDSVIIDVVDNDTDVDGTINAATVMVMGDASNGSTSVDALSGAITYTPNADFNGSDSFTYVVQDDATGTSNAATVTITINSINDAPVAANDTAVLQEDAAMEINVLGNDTDVDGTLVLASVEVVTAVTDGSTSINTTTGAITYTANADFFGSDTFTYRVRDNDGEWSSPATVTITVNSVNDLPVAANDTASTNEDTAVVINLIANDTDVDDGLDIASVVIVNDVTNGSLVNNNDGTVTYTPTANTNGSDSFTYEVSDLGGATSATATVTITVTPVNDAPEIGGAPPASVSAGALYSFTPSASDVENNTLTFSAINLPSWISLNTATGAISGTPGRTDEGVYSNITLSVSDGVDSTALATFAIEVVHNSALDSDADGIPDDVELSNNLNPDNGNDASEDTDGDGVSNLDEYTGGSNIRADDYPPVFGALDTLSINATGLLTKLPALTVPQAVDGLDGSITATLLTSSPLLAPGVHTLTWAAQDAAGNSAQATQQVRVYPQISLGKNQVRAEGAAAMVRFLLNGVSPVYPFTVGYTVSGTADSNDHNLSSGTVVFTAGETEQAVFLMITEDNVSEGTETLRVTLDAATSTSGSANFGVKRVHDLSIVEENVAPTLKLSLRQNGQEVRIVTQDGGLVTVSASVDDPNPGDTHQYSWTFPSLTVNDVSNAVKTFDPTALNSGVYNLSLTVTDSHSSPLATRNGLSFQVRATAPVLDNSTDSDGDGLSDLVEGLGDEDGDGQPDYLDAISLSNVLNERSGDAGRFLVEADPGIRLNLGQFALENGADGAHLDILELPADSEFANEGGFFNMVARDVPDLGASVNIVIPQRQAIPSNARYRKFNNGVWFTFVADANNSVASAPGEEGLCPPPGSDDYTAGLTSGYWCVQLTIEDGGANDADGEANGTVEDPGGVGQPLATQTQARASGGGGSIGWEVLLLVALFMLRFRRSSAIACLIVAASQTQAADTQAKDSFTNKANWYVQTALGQVDTDWSTSSFENKLANISLGAVSTDVDKSRFGWDLLGGWQWRPWLALEAGYVDMGEVDLKAEAAVINTTALQQLLEDEYPRSGKGPYVGVRLNHGITLAEQPITLFLKAGLWHWQGEYTITAGSNRESVESDGDDLLWGVGASLPVFDQIEIGLQLQQTQLDGDQQLQTAIQLLYRFK